MSYLKHYKKPELLNEIFKVRLKVKRSKFQHQAIFSIHRQLKRINIKRIQKYTLMNSRLLYCRYYYTFIDSYDVSSCCCTFVMLILFFKKTILDLLMSIFMGKVLLKKQNGSCPTKYLQFF